MAARNDPDMAQRPTQAPRRYTGQRPGRVTPHLPLDPCGHRNPHRATDGPAFGRTVLAQPDYQAAPHGQGPENILPTPQDLF